MEERGGYAVHLLRGRGESLCVCLCEKPAPRIANALIFNRSEQNDYLSCTSLSAIVHGQRLNAIDDARTCVQLLLGAGADPTVSELKRTDMGLSQPLVEVSRWRRSPLDSWWGLSDRPFEVCINETNMLSIVDLWEGRD